MSVQIKSVSLCSFGRESSAWELVMTSGRNASSLGCREKQRKDRFLKNIREDVLSHSQMFGLWVLSAWLSYRKGQIIFYRVRHRHRLKMRGYRILCSPDIPKDCLQNAEGKSETDPILQDAPLLSIHVKVSILRILILHFQFPPVAKTYFLGKIKERKTRGKLSGIKVHLGICCPDAKTPTEGLCREKQFP